MKRIVVTGGPGAGKTASLEVARRTLCEHVGFVRESASIVFGGGFPRETRESSECAAQRAIFRVQRELESMFDDRVDLDLVLCDRGTVDCAAYWPRSEAHFYRELGTTRADELARYAAVIPFEGQRLSAHGAPTRVGGGHREDRRSDRTIVARPPDALLRGAHARLFRKSGPSHGDRRGRPLVLARAEELSPRGAGAMKVDRVMTRDVWTCGPDDALRNGRVHAGYGKVALGRF